MDLSFVVSSNGWSLYEDRVKWLANYPVKLELSLDGDRETQNRSRGPYKKSEDPTQMESPLRRRLFKQAVCFTT